MGCFACTRAADASSCCSNGSECILGVCGAVTLVWSDCAAGGFGADGRRQHAVAPRAQGPPRSLAIYVYETLPLDLGATSFSLRTWFSNLRDFEVYSTECASLTTCFVIRRFGLSTVRRPTILVPTLGSLGRCRGLRGTPVHAARAAELLVRSIRSRYPFWDRSGGRDHVFFLTGDQGACGLGKSGTRPIFITAWGLLGTSSKMSAFETFRDDFINETEIDRAISAGEYCHAPHKDVVVPPYGDLQFTDNEPATAMQGGFEHSLLHVGGVWGAGNHGTRKISFYSQGMRQALYLRFGDNAHGANAGIWIRNRSMSKAQLTHKTAHSKFCLSPSGHGWGMRTGKNAVLGCVPLIAQPFVVQPFEMLLPYELFSKRVAFEDVPRIPEIVNVTDETVYLMRRRLARVRRAFIWRVEAGGLAYNHTLLHLCHRAYELRGALKLGRALTAPPRRRSCRRVTNAAHAELVSCDLESGDAAITRTASTGLRPACTLNMEQAGPSR